MKCRSFCEEQGLLTVLGQSTPSALLKKPNVLFIFVSDDPVHAAPTTSTRVFYISVGVCCAVIFLVAIILAVLHLHSMKRIELDDRYCTCFGKGKKIKSVACICMSAPTPHPCTLMQGRRGEDGPATAKEEIRCLGYCLYVCLFIFSILWSYNLGRSRGKWFTSSLS